MSGERTIDWNDAAFTNGTSTADTPSIEQALEAAKQFAGKFQGMATGVALSPADYDESIRSLPQAVVPFAVGGFGSLGALYGLRVFSDRRIPAGRMLELHGSETVDQAIDRIIATIAAKDTP